MEHPQTLAALGWAERVDRFARNTMCVLARPEVDVSTDTVLRTMLDPKIRLGTSTPKADPSGDYAWRVFHKADVMQPGSFATLSAKAMQLTGGPQSAPPPTDRSVYGALLAQNRADIFLTYCTNAELSRKEQAGFKSVKLPSTLEVGADCGMAVARSAEAPARARFVLGAEGSSPDCTGTASIRRDTRARGRAGRPADSGGRDRHCDCDCAEQRHARCH